MWHIVAYLIAQLNFSVYLDFHLFHEKADRPQQGNLLTVAPVTNVGNVFVYMPSFQGRVQFKSMEEFFWQQTNFEGFDMWL